MNIQHRTPLRLLLLLMLSLAGDWSQAQAQQHNQFASVGLILEDVRNQPCNFSGPGCNDEDVKIKGELYLPYYAYVCVFNATRDEGVAGMSFAIEYDGPTNVGVDIWEWRHCAALEFSESAFPRTSGSGTTITWLADTDCQDDVPSGADGVTAVGGYFYISAYSEGLLELVPRSVSNNVIIANCDLAETPIDPDKVGFVAFSEDLSLDGSLPCRTKVVEQETWGAIKRTLSNSN